MTIDLIGAHCSWNGHVLPPPQRERFATALGVFSQRAAEHQHSANTLLAATGKRRGWVPQIAPDGSRVLFAGHIDNRRQLAKELAVKEQSDEALYTAAYAAWGDAADLRVLGQFATIIVQPGGRGIRLSRSPIAAPPLFYWHDDERLIVASLATTIFATGEVERRADRSRIAQELLRIPDVERSYFAGISLLPVGHRATCSQERVRIASYYDLADLPEIRLANDDEYVAAALELLCEGVRAAVEDFSRPAISLSGGYDSQAVAALLARERPGERIEAFTSVSEPEWRDATDTDRFSDERSHVEALAVMYSEIRPHWVDAAGLNLDHKQATIFAAAGAPGPSVLGPWTHEIYRQAKAAGCDVMLEAVAGNYSFSFGQHGVLATMARTGRWMRLWSEAGHLSRGEPRSRLRIIASDAVLPLVPDRLYISLNKLLRTRRAGSLPAWCPLNGHDGTNAQVGDQARAAMYLKNRMPRSGRAARAYMPDCAESSQAFGLLYGIAQRDPTNYRPLVEFCLGIPDLQYLKDGKKRWLARRMLKGLVPDMVANETRRGLRAADWHLRMARQRHQLIKEIDRLGESPELAELIDFESLRQVLSEWPETAPSIGDDAKLKYAVLDGLMAARLIRFIEGIN